MKTREELIENARRDIADAERCQALHITPATGTILRRLREVTNALAMFEKAHAPIDDEREGAAERIIGQHLSRLSKRDGWAEDDTAIGGQAANIVRQLSEAGLLRRSEVPEPSNTERIARSIAESSSWQFGQAMALVRAVEALTPSEAAQSLSPEPQGEPSDAQVLVALNEYESWSAEESLDMWGTDQVERMRAALRAAGGAR